MTAALFGTTVQIIFNLDKLEKLQNRAARVITGKTYDTDKVRVVARRDNWGGGGYIHVHIP